MNQEDLKLYDINKRFSTEEERIKIFKQQACLKIAKDMIINPENYNKEQVSLVENNLRDLEEELNIALVMLDSNYCEDGLFRLNHMLDVFVLDDQRLQDLDNITISFLLTAQINTTIDLIIILTHNLFVLKECGAFENNPHPAINELDMIKMMIMSIDLNTN